MYEALFIISLKTGLYTFLIILLETKQGQQQPFVIDFR